MLQPKEEKFETSENLSSEEFTEMKDKEKEDYENEKGTKNSGQYIPNDLIYSDESIKKRYESDNDFKIMEKLSNVEQKIFNGGNDEYNYEIRGDSQDFSGSSEYSGKKDKKAVNLPSLNFSYCDQKFGDNLIDKIQKTKANFNNHYQSYLNNKNKFETDNVIKEEDNYETPKGNYDKKNVQNKNNFDDLYYKDNLGDNYEFKEYNNDNIDLNYNIKNNNYEISSFKNGNQLEERNENNKLREEIQISKNDISNNESLYKNSYSNYKNEQINNINEKQGNIVPEINMKEKEINLPKNENKIINQKDKKLTKDNRLLYYTENKDENPKSENEIIYKTEDKYNIKESHKTNKNNYYFFNYDSCLKIRNFSQQKTGKTDYSTEQNSIKVNLDSKNNDIKEYKEKKSKTIESNRHIVAHNLNEEKNINEFSINDDKQNQNKNIDSYNINLEKMKYNNNINEVKIDIDEKKTNDNKILRKNINNLKIDENKYLNEKNKNIITKIIGKEEKKNNKLNYFNNIKKNESNTVRDFKYYNNLENNKNNDKANNDIIKEAYKNKNKTGDAFNLYKSDSINSKDANNNAANLSDSNSNSVSIESFTLKKLDEEDKSMTLRIEKEEKKLNELENEKHKLIAEEQDLSKKILEEIQRQEKQEKKEKEKKERKRKMRKKYQESLQKKKENEERLRLIKQEQEKQLKQINDLIYKKQLDEKKLSMLIEGKLDKNQRQFYTNSLQKPKYKSSENLFQSDPKRINKIKYPDSEEYLIKRMKNNYITKDPKIWNMNENKKSNEFINNDIENFINNKSKLRKNNFKNKQTSYVSTAFNSYQNMNTHKRNDNLTCMISKGKSKNISNKKAVSIRTNPNEYNSLYPSITYHKNLSGLGPIPSIYDDSKNKLYTEINQSPSFYSTLHNIEKTQNRILTEKNVQEIHNKNIMDKNSKEISKKSNIANIKKSYSNKDEIEDYYNYGNMKNTLKSKVSFNELKKNKYNNPQMFKTRSTPKLDLHLNYNSNELYQPNNNKSNKPIKQTKKYTQLSYNNLDNYMMNDGNKFNRENSFIEDIDKELPLDIKNEALMEYNKIENNRINSLLNYKIMGKHNDKSKKGTIVDALKKESSVEEYMENGNKDFDVEKKIGKDNRNYLRENKSRFLPYYKEIYG